MDNKNSGGGGGITFGGMLCIVFIVLKLCGVINWSWVWVLSPLWIGFILAVIIIVVAIILSRK